MWLGLIRSCSSGRALRVHIGFESAFCGQNDYSKPVSRVSQRFSDKTTTQRLFHVWVSVLRTKRLLKASFACESAFCGQNDYSKPVSRLSQRFADKTTTQPLLITIINKKSYPARLSKIFLFARLVFLIEFQHILRKCNNCEKCNHDLHPEYTRNLESCENDG